LILRHSYIFVTKNPFSHEEKFSIFYFSEAIQIPSYQKGTRERFRKTGFLSNPFCQQRLTFKTKANGGQPQ
jgi:hypothetical protein